MIPTINDDPRWTIVDTPWSSCSWTHSEYVSFAGWGKSKLETKLSFNHIIIWTKNQNSVVKTTYVISWCPWMMKINKKLLKWSKLFSWKIVMDTNLITCLSKKIEAQLTSICSRCPTHCSFLEAVKWEMQGMAAIQFHDSNQPHQRFSVQRCQYLFGKEWICSINGGQFWDYFISLMKDMVVKPESFLPIIIFLIPQLLGQKSWNFCSQRCEKMTQMKLRMRVTGSVEQFLL